MRVSGGDMRKAITYLQSAARLRGEDTVTEEDIREISGVSSVVHKLFIWELGVCMAFIS